MQFKFKYIGTTCTRFLVLCPICESSQSAIYESKDKKSGMTYIIM